MLIHSKNLVLNRRYSRFIFLNFISNKTLGLQQYILSVVRLKKIFYFYSIFKKIFIFNVLAKVFNYILKPKVKKYNDILSPKCSVFVCGDFKKNKFTFFTKIFSNFFFFLKAIFYSQFYYYFSTKKFVKLKKFSKLSVGDANFKLQQNLFLLKFYKFFFSSSCTFTNKLNSLLSNIYRKKLFFKKKN